MKNLKKKAFTLVELLVVIAIIAILAVAGVVGYVVFTKKAQQSNDSSLVSQLNEYMIAATTTDDINTVTDARDLLINDGIDLASLKPTAKGYRVAFDIANKKFVKVKDNTPEDYSGAAEDLFVFVSSEADATSFSNAGYSVYLQNGFNAASITVSSGLDVGENAGITAVSYTNAGAGKEVTIRSNNDQCTLTINAPNDDVNYYGFAKVIDVKDVKLTSLHIFGSANKLQVEKGHVQVEDTGIVFDVVQIGATTGTQGAGASITNKGFIAAASLSNHASATDQEKAAIKESVAAQAGSKAIGGDYEIDSLARFESFRDAVNAGNDFAGLTIKLTSNIVLNDGWKPIGEGSRKVGSQALADGVTAFFAGTFDGNNKIISNLNNKGFVPTQARLVKDDGYDPYAYGLFALVKGATIKNLTLSNVDIDTNDRGTALGDSVGALVGYSAGATTISNITVNGTVAGYDGVGGVVGRARGIKLTISNCTNNATVKGIRVTAGVVGSLGVTDEDNTISNCRNTGSVTCEYVTDFEHKTQGYYYAAGIFNINGAKESAKGNYVVVSCTNAGTITNAGTYHSGQADHKGDIYTTLGDAPVSGKITEA